MKECWSDLSVKEQIQYAVAVLLIISGIAAAFVSIICNAFNIATGVLIYIAQAFITAGGIFGVSIYFKTKLGEFDTRQANHINESIEKVLDHIDSKLEYNRNDIEQKIDNK